MVNQTLPCVRPWRNGMDVTQRPADKWIVDFAEHSENEATLFEAPFAHVLQHVKPERDGNAEKNTREKYWLFKRSAADMKRAIGSLPRSIATPEVAKYRVFVWLAPRIRSRQKPYRNRPRRRRHLRHPAFPLPRTLVAAPRHLRSKTVRATPQAPPSKPSLSRPA